jgi:hypothetical protein
MPAVKVDQVYARETRGETATSSPPMSGPATRGVDSRADSARLRRTAKVVPPSGDRWRTRSHLRLFAARDQRQAGGEGSAPRDRRRRPSRDGRDWPRRGVPVSPSSTAARPDTLGHEDALAGRGPRTSGRRRDAVSDQPLAEEADSGTEQGGIPDRRVSPDPHGQFADGPVAITNYLHTQRSSLTECRRKTCERTLQNVAKPGSGEGYLGVRKQQVLSSNLSVGSTRSRVKAGLRAGFPFPRGHRR